MRTFRVHTPLLTAAAVVLLASPAWAQKLEPVKPADADRPPDVYRMEIYNGPMRTVHYVTPSYMSPGDSASLRELERTENELALVDQFFNLRVQYAMNEQALEAKRRTMQELLYGYNRDESTSYNYNASGPAAVWPGYGGIVGGFPGMYGYLGGNWWGGGWGGQVGGSDNTSHTLAVGVGMNEGAIKTALAQNLMSPAPSEGAALASRNYKAALAAIYDNPRLVAGLGLPKTGPGTLTEFDPNASVVYLKDGSKFTGKITKQDADWITLEMDKPKRTEQVRMSEVTRISHGSGVKPAGNKE
jgi:hypothetical protein